MKLIRLTVARSEAGTDLQSFLVRRLSISRNKAKQLLDRRDVFVNRQRVWMARHTLAAGDEIEVAADGNGNPVPRPGVRLLYDDEHLVIADKPAGCLANGPGSIEDTLRREQNCPGLAAVHRLDRDTSGCLILARTADARADMDALFRDRAIVKTYHAIVTGALRRREQTIRQPVDGLPATSHCRVLDANAAATHVLVRIETGRTHQIRRHMAFIGHPVLGDRHYATRDLAAPERRAVERQMLHAYSVAFRHPRTGTIVRAVAPIPGDFQRMLRRLKLT